MGVITFNGVNSSAFGIEVSSPPRYRIPEEDVSQIHVLGRNGDHIHRYRSFKNIQLDYAITFLAPQYRYGDVDRDGAITAFDSSAVLRYLAGNETFTPEQVLLADVNHDGIVSSQDAYEILMHLVGASDLPFESLSVNYMASLISGWLHPYYTDMQLKNFETMYLGGQPFKASRDGYFRLEDTYNPDFFRMALYKNTMDIVNVYDQGAAASLTFEAMPQKWYKSGEIWTEGSPVSQNDFDSSSMYLYDENAKKLYNPSGYPAWPIIRIDMNSAVYYEDNIGTIAILNVPAEAITVNSNGNAVITKPWFITEKKIKFAHLLTSMEDNFNVNFQNGHAYSYIGTALPPTIELKDSQLKTRINMDTGILTPGLNIILVTIAREDGSGSSREIQYPDFEILPRWWTL